MTAEEASVDDDTLAECSDFGFLPVFTAAPARQNQTWHESKTQWVRATTTNVDTNKVCTSEMWSAIQHLERVAASHEEARLSRIAADKAEAERRKRDRAQYAAKVKKDVQMRREERGMEEKRKRDDESEANKAAAERAELFRQSEEKRLAREAKVAARHKSETQAMLTSIQGVKVNIQHYSSKMYGQLKMCEQRLRMRAKRLDHDRFDDDPVQQALECERDVVLNARRELWVGMQECTETEECLYAGQARLKKLSGDREKGILSLETKHSVGQSVSLPSLTNTFSEPQTFSPVASRTVTLPSLPAASRSNSFSAMSCAPPARYLPVKEDKGLEGISVPDLFQLLCERVESAKRLSKKGSLAIQKTDDECTGAALRTQECLDKSRADLEDLKRSLETQRTEADKAIIKAEKWITRIQRLIVRSRGASASDEVQFLAAEQVLAQLKESRQRLEEDFRCKVAALKIEESCRALTVSRVDARASLRKRNDLGRSKAAWQFGNTRSEERDSNPSAFRGWFAQNAENVRAAG